MAVSLGDGVNGTQLWPWTAVARMEGTNSKEPAGASSACLEKVKTSHKQGKYFAKHLSDKGPISKTCKNA